MKKLKGPFRLIAISLVNNPLHPEWTVKVKEADNETNASPGGSPRPLR